MVAAGIIWLEDGRKIVGTWSLNEDGLCCEDDQGHTVLQFTDKDLVDILNKYPAYAQAIIQHVNR